MARAYNDERANLEEAPLTDGLPTLTMQGSPRSYNDELISPRLAEDDNQEGVDEDKDLDNEEDDLDEEDFDDEEFEEDDFDDIEDDDFDELDEDENDDDVDGDKNDDDVDGDNEF